MGEENRKILRPCLMDGLAWYIVISQEWTAAKLQSHSAGLKGQWCREILSVDRAASIPGHQNYMKEEMSWNQNINRLQWLGWLINSGILEEWRQGAWGMKSVDRPVKWHKLGRYLCSCHCPPEIKLHRGYIHESSGLEESTIGCQPVSISGHSMYKRAMK